MPVAEEYGVRLDMEILNRFENYILNTVAEGIAFAKAVDSKNCGLLLDTFHMSVEEDDFAAAIKSAKDYIGKLHTTEPNRKIPFHNTRINWPEIGRALKYIGFDKPIIIEAVVAFDDEGSYNMRMWRDQIADTSIEGRITELKRGIAFLKEQFEDT
jgi:D-psicose/D-tagatose/L-ribulose 3-epimerase